MDYFAAAALGAAFGGAQLCLLILAVRGMGRGKVLIWAFAAQFLCPFAGLLLCVLLARSRLALCAGVICAILIVGGVVGFLRMRRENIKPEKKD